jgi:hypothetical protein
MSVLIPNYVQMISNQPGKKLGGGDDGMATPEVKKSSMILEPLLFTVAIKLLSESVTCH